MQILTNAYKLDMPYDFYIKRKIHAAEWKLKAMINKNKKFINKLKGKGRHTLIRNFE